MECREAKMMIDDLLDGDLDEQGRRSLEQHMAECQACARHLEDFSVIEQWARKLGLVSPRSGFAERVMAHLASERPIPEVLRKGFGFIIAAMIVMSVISAILGGSELAYGWMAIAAGSIGETFSAIAADLAEMGNEAFAGIAAFWISVEQWQGPLSPLWMAVTVLAALLLMVIFNFVQARTLSHRT